MSIAVTSPLMMDGKEAASPLIINAHPLEDSPPTTPKSSSKSDPFFQSAYHTKDNLQRFAYLIRCANKYRNALASMSSAATQFAGAIRAMGDGIMNYHGAGIQGQELGNALHRIAQVHALLAEKQSTVRDAMLREFDEPLRGLLHTHTKRTADQEKEYTKMIKSTSGAVRETRRKALKAQKKQKNPQKIMQTRQNFFLASSQHEHLQTHSVSEIISQEMETFATIYAKSNTILGLEIEAYQSVLQLAESASGDTIDVKVTAPAQKRPLYQPVSAIRASGTPNQPTDKLKGDVIFSPEALAFQEQILVESAKPISKKLQPALRRKNTVHREEKNDKPQSGTRRTGSDDDTSCDASFISTNAPLTPASPSRIFFEGNAGDIPADATSLLDTVIEHSHGYVPEQLATEVPHAPPARVDLNPSVVIQHHVRRQDSSEDFTEQFQEDDDWDNESQSQRMVYHHHGPLPDPPHSNPYSAAPKHRNVVPHYPTRSRRYFAESPEHQTVKPPPLPLPPPMTGDSGRHSAYRTAKFDFVARNDRELTIHKEEILTVIKRGEDVAAALIAKELDHAAGLVDDDALEEAIQGLPGDVRYDHEKMNLWLYVMNQESQKGWVPKSYTGAYNVNEQ